MVKENVYLLAFCGSIVQAWVLAQVQTMGNYLVPISTTLLNTTKNEVALAHSLNYGLFILFGIFMVFVNFQSPLVRYGVGGFLGLTWAFSMLSISLWVTNYTQFFWIYVICVGSAASYCWWRMLLLFVGLVIPGDTDSMRRFSVVIWFTNILSQGVSLAKSAIDKTTGDWTLPWTIYSGIGFGTVLLFILISEMAVMNRYSKSTVRAPVPLREPSHANLIFMVTYYTAIALFQFVFLTPFIAMPLQIETYYRPLINANTSTVSVATETRDIVMLLSAGSFVGRFVLLGIPIISASFLSKRPFMQFQFQVLSWIGFVICIITWLVATNRFNLVELKAIAFFYGLFSGAIFAYFPTILSGRLRGIFKPATITSLFAASLTPGAFAHGVIASTVIAQYGDVTFVTVMLVLSAFSLFFVLVAYSFAVQAAMQENQKKNAETAANPVVERLEKEIKNPLTIS